MTAQEAYVLARAYANKLIEGGGALKGAACQIQSITPITGGNRITFLWEDNDGVQSTETMDVMDGANGQDGSDGADGVGIVSITYKSEDAQGNYIYTVALSDSTSYDITCPKGAKGDTGATGATGADGQDGADGVGITSITKTGTSGLVDTYTITYTNGTTSTFTVTNGQDGNANEFIGTMAQWEALTAEQKKAFDTYQITDDYSEALMPNYSTVEQKTGQKWIDGKDIYFKVYHIDHLGNNTDVTLEAGFGDNKTIIKTEGVISTSTAEGKYQFDANYYSNGNDCTFVCVVQSNLIARSRDNYSGYSSDFIVYYTKTA